MCCFVLLWFSAVIGDSLLKRLRPLQEEERTDFGVIQAATLTLLGLIIGFNFSMALGRYDQRKAYEAEEATRSVRSMSALPCCLLPTQPECVIS